MKHIFSIAVLTVIVFSQGCSKKENSPGPAACSQVAQPKGFALSPIGFPADYGKVLDFFAEVGSLGDSAVMANTAWRDSAAEAGSIPRVATMVMNYSSTYCFAPVTVFGWRTGNTPLLEVSGNNTNDWSNGDAKALFKTMVTNFAQRKPPYIFLGNESDFYYEHDSTDYSRWLTAYDELYEAIKTVSPTTLVGPVFNYEHLAGKGGLNGWTTTNWPALDNHTMSKVDVIGVTLYPFFGNVHGADVPTDYLDDLISHASDKPIVITETGWPAENEGALNPVWATSEQDQVDYVGTLFAAISGKNIKLINWLFLNGMTGATGDNRIFGSISVRTSAGAKRAVYDAWVEK